MDVRLLLLLLAIVFLVGFFLQQGDCGYEPLKSEVRYSGVTIIVEQVSVTRDGGGARVEASFTIARPNPCYNVTFQGVRVEADQVVFVFSVGEPDPDTFCIQVVPPPERIKAEGGIGGLGEGVVDVVIALETRSGVVQERIGVIDCGLG